MCWARITCQVCLGLLVFALPPTLGQSPQGRTDANGDQLPAGALVRIGTIRWRCGTAYASALGADGRSVFVSSGNSIRVFDLATGLMQRTIQGPEEQHITALAVSPDGKILASGGYKGVILWDAESGKQQRPLKVGAVAVLNFSPDGKKLITGGEDQDRSVRVIDVGSGKEELRMLWHRRRVSLVACVPGGKTLVTASGWDNDIRIADLSTGDVIYTIQQKNAYDTVVALSPDGKMLAVADGRFQQRHLFHGLRLVDVATGKERQKLDPGKVRTIALVFSPDGKSLVSSSDKGFRVWDVASGKLKRDFPGGGFRLHITPDSRRLIAVASVIRVWDLESGTELHPPEGPLAAADALDLSPDGTTLASSSFGDREAICLWDATTGKQKGLLHGHDSYVRAVQFAPDGRLVSGGGDSTLRVWDVVAKKEVFQFKLHEPRAGEKPLQVTTMNVSRDGRILAAAALGFEREETVQVFVWNLANGKLLALHMQKGRFFDWPGFSTDGKTMLTRGENGGLILKDLITDKEITKLQPAPQPGAPGVLNPNVLENPYNFSPDGRLVAVRGSRQRNEGLRYWRDNYAIVLFDLASSKETHRIGVADWRSAAVFSADGKRLAGSDGRVVRIWQTATGKGLWQSPALDYHVTALAFSPDGTRLATALDNTTTLIWDVSLKK